MQKKIIHRTKDHSKSAIIFTSSLYIKKNINCTIEESIDRFRPVVTEAKEHNIQVRGYLSCVIGCPYEGKIAPQKVADIASRLLDLGCYEISLGDTIGVGTPASTIEMIDSVLTGIGNEPNKLAVHFHDT